MTTTLLRKKKPFKQIHKTQKKTLEKIEKYIDADKTKMKKTNK